MKRYIHKCAYVPMLEEFKIIDVFEDLEPNLTSIKMNVLDAFLNEVDVKVISTGCAQRDRTGPMPAMPIPMW